MALLVLHACHAVLSRVLCGSTGFTRLPEEQRAGTDLGPNELPEETAAGGQNFWAPTSSQRKPWQVGEPLRSQEVPRSNHGRSADASGLKEFGNPRHTSLVPLVECWARCVRNKKGNSRGCNQKCRSILGSGVCEIK